MIAEETLVQQLQSKDGQARAFEVLVGTYKQRLYWHIRRIVLHHEDADDALQNTFIKVYKNIAGFNGKSKLYTWMYRIATNEALTLLKKRSKKRGIGDQELQDKMLENLKADVYFEGDEIQLKLQQAIATLPEKQKLVFNLKYFDELKYTEISEILGTSVGGLKASYHLAVKKIEAFLKDDS
ncbi:MAG: RNA polymerase sigma factor [Pricia sp.]